MHINMVPTLEMNCGTSTTVSSQHNEC